MVIDRRKAILFTSAAVLRLIFFFAFPSLPDLLTGRVEISTPVTSFKRREHLLPFRSVPLMTDLIQYKKASSFTPTMFLRTTAVSSTRQVPLPEQKISSFVKQLIGSTAATALRPHPSLPLSACNRPSLRPHRSALRECANTHHRVRRVWLLTSLHIAVERYEMGQHSGGSGVSLHSSYEAGFRTDGAVRYLFNPFTVATCVGRPTSVFTNCAILYAIAQAVSGKPITSMLSLALASYLSLYPALLLPPLVLLCYDRRVRESKAPLNGTFATAQYITAFFASIGWFLYLSNLLIGGGSEYLASTYGVHLLLPDLTPNVGLWWYFFIEMFDSFREFFLGVFWLHLGGYVGALCIRLRTQPLFVITTLLGIFAIFKPYPSISDTSLYFAMLPLYRHVFPRESSLSNHLH